MGTWPKLKPNSEVAAPTSRAFRQATGACVYVRWNQCVSTYLCTCLSARALQEEIPHQRVHAHRGRGRLRRAPGGILVSIGNFLDVESTNLSRDNLSRGITLSFFVLPGRALRPLPRDPSRPGALGWRGPAPRKRGPSARRGRSAAS